MSVIKNKQSTRQPNGSKRETFFSMTSMIISVVAMIISIVGV